MWSGSRRASPLLRGLGFAGLARLGEGLDSDGAGDVGGAGVPAVGLDETVLGDAHVKHGTQLLEHA